jgi:hypothetical protein
LAGLVLIGLVLAAPAGAQEVPPGALPDLVTDRPDFTESSEAVVRGVLQFETGFAYERTGAGVERVGSVTAPTSLLRVGLMPRVELRFGTDGILSTDQGGVRSTGVGDFEVGAKIRLLSQAAAGLDVAIIPIVSLPTGSQGVSADSVDPTVKFTWARDLPAGVGLSGNYNLSSLSDGNDRFVQQALSVSVGHDLALGFGGYLETYGFVPVARDGDARWTLDFGVSRMIGRDMQFDIEGGHSLAAEPSGWFVGFGFAIRGRAWARK